MYITINDIKGEKRIDLSYSINSNKEITVIIMLSDNIQYNVLKLRSVMDPDTKQGRRNRSDHSDLGRTKNLVIYGQSLVISVFWSDQ